MGVRDKRVKGGNGINYSKEVDSSLDYSGLTNDTYFKNLDDGLIYWKSTTGAVVGLFIDNSISQYTISFVEVEQVLQVFDESLQFTEILTHNIDTLAYDKNETDTFTPLVIPGGLPTDVAIGDTITWQITYSAGKDKASMNIIGNKKG